MELTWRLANRVELAENAYLLDAEGTRTTHVSGARFAVEGGYVHLQVPGRADVQVVSAPMVRHISYAPPQ